MVKKKKAVDESIIDQVCEKTSQMINKHRDPTFIRLMKSRIVPSREQKVPLLVVVRLRVSVFCSVDPRVKQSIVETTH
jgi:hypothetical protein